MKINAPSRVSVEVNSAGSLSCGGDPALTLEMIHIEIRWGVNKASDRWSGDLVKDPVILSLLDKIKGKASPHAAKIYAAKLPDFYYLDHRFGSCEALLTPDNGKRSDRYLCNAPIIFPGLDGYKCSRCGWVHRGGLQ